jgi:hypothetical protein
MIHTDNVKLTETQEESPAAQEVTYLLRRFLAQIDEDLVYELVLRAVAVSQGEVPRT